MAEIESDVKWRDTSLKQLIIFDIGLFGSAIFMSVILFFLGIYMAIPIGEFIDWIILQAIDLLNLINSAVGGAIIVLYMLAFIFAIAYGLYALFTYGIIRLLRINKIPQFRYDCRFREFCYAQSKWNKRVNKVLFVVGIFLGLVFVLLTPGLISSLTTGTSMVGDIMVIIFLMVSFGLPLFRFFVILSDVSFFAHYDPSLAMRKKMYLTYIIALSIWNGVLITFILWLNIPTGFLYALSLSYILFYILAISSLISLIAFVVKYLKIRKK